MRNAAESNTEAFARAAADLAMRGAVDYGLKKSEPTLRAKIDALVTALRRHVKAALPGALEDARAALDAHLDRQAELTFAASMRLAGIAAAKEVLG